MRGLPRRPSATALAAMAAASLAACAGGLRYASVNGSRLGGHRLRAVEGEPNGFGWCDAGRTSIDSRGAGGRSLRASVDGALSSLSVHVDGGTVRGISAELGRTHYDRIWGSEMALHPRRSTLRIEWLAACPWQGGWLLGWIESVIFDQRLERTEVVTIVRLDAGQDGSVVLARFSPLSSRPELSHLAMGAAPDGRVAIRVVEGASGGAVRFLVLRPGPGRTLRVEED